MSLKRIELKDFVIVRSLQLDLQSGFSVLTGETGAGKSILIDAVQLVLGGRADAGAVREGAARADIAAEFDLPAALTGWLDAAGFEHSETLLLRRTIDNTGKSRGWINGSAATATQLREVGERLVDIHGQHAWQSLTRPESVRSLLDAYCGVNAAELYVPWRAWQSARQQVAQAKQAQDSLQQERERLAWQIEEVSKLAPGDDEWDELNAQHSRLANAQTLLDAAHTTIDALDGETGGALRSLNQAIQNLRSQTAVAPEFGDMADVLASGLAQVEDAVHSLHSWQRRVDLDPSRLDELDKRMALWVSLARRYRRPPSELAGLLAGWRQESARLDAAADLNALEAAEAAARAAYLSKAQQLSKARAKAAPLLGKAISSAMQGLGMQGGVFQVNLTKLDEPAAHGLDGVEFLVAGHAGSTPRAVGKVASGGELSRIALAIAVTTSQLGEAGTLIFDEVDTGVGGAVAETVGRLMKQLGVDRQVLAVTHLPQVAACADHHLVVSKQTDAAGTYSSVAATQGERRTDEIARMLGGERLSKTTLAHAKEMLQLAQHPPRNTLSA